MVELIDYLPYGNPRVTLGSYTPQRKYIGQHFDTATNLNYLNARYYNAVNGQFISEDPVFWELGQSENGKKALLNPQSQNSYSYALNNPVTYSDPDGKFIPLIIGGLYMAAPYIITGIGLAATATTAYFTAHDTGTIAGTAMSSAPASYKNEVYNGIVENWGAGLSVASQLAPAVAGEARVGARTTLQANKAAGAAFEAQEMGNLSKTFPDIQPQTTLKTLDGVKTRIDMIARDTLGNICLFECKSSATAPLTKNQSLAFPQIEKSGATVVGNGKPGFPGDTVIPPTKVNIIRPN